MGVVTFLATLLSSTITYFLLRRFQHADFLRQRKFEQLQELRDTAVSIFLDSRTIASGVHEPGSNLPGLMHSVFNKVTKLETLALASIVDHEVSQLAVDYASHANQQVMKLGELIGLKKVGFDDEAVDEVIASFVTPLNKLGESCEKAIRTRVQNVTTHPQRYVTLSPAPHTPPR